MNKMTLGDEYRWYKLDPETDALVDHLPMVLIFSHTKILDYMIRMPKVEDWTAREMLEEWRRSSPESEVHEICTISGRMSELRKWKVLVSTGKRECTVSGMTVIANRINWEQVRIWDREQAERETKSGFMHIVEQKSISDVSDLFNVVKEEK